MRQGGPAALSFRNIARGLGCSPSVFYNYLPNVDNAAGRSAEGQAHIERALEASRSAGDGAGVAMALSNLSDLALTSGDYARGAQLATEALEVAGPNGDPHIVQISHINAATGFVRTGRFDEAEAAVHQAMRLGRQLDDPLTISGGLRILALAAIGRGDPRRAARLMALARRWTADVNNPLEPTEQALDDTIRAELDRMDPQVRAAEERMGEALSLDAIDT